MKTSLISNIADYYHPRLVGRGLEVEEEERLLALLEPYRFIMSGPLSDEEVILENDLLTLSRNLSEDVRARVAAVLWYYIIDTQRFEVVSAEEEAEMPNLIREVQELLNDPENDDFLELMVDENPIVMIPLTLLSLAESLSVDVMDLFNTLKDPQTFVPLPLKKEETQ